MKFDARCLLTMSNAIVNLFIQQQTDHMRLDASIDAQQSVHSKNPRHLNS
jgi:hypothetical protein